MRSRILTLVWTGVLTLVLSGIGAAQYHRQKPSDTDKVPAGKTMTVTGCLQKGDEAGEYTIKGTDGKTYALRSTSTSVKLSDHLNQKVTATGKTVAEPEKKDQTKKTEKEGYAHLDVTTVKMISTTCS